VSVCTCRAADGLHMQDIESGLYYSLWSEIPTHESFGRQQISALRLYLDVLYKVLSRPPPPTENEIERGTESGQGLLSDPLSGVLRPKFGLRPDLSQNLIWRWRFGLRIFLD